MNTLFPTLLTLTLMQDTVPGDPTQWAEVEDNVVGVLYLYKALSVLEQSHARQFARYSSDFHKKRLWVGELKMLEEGCTLSLTEPQARPTVANIEICVELADSRQG